MPSRATRTEKLDLRLTRAAKLALQAAAAASHRSVSEFVLDSALSKADEALAERAGVRSERRTMERVPGRVGCSAAPSSPSGASSEGTWIFRCRA
jgi:uncharacterized protein (DUF1778 family)